MNYREACTAIEEILASIPDSELPEFTKIEVEKEKPVVWWGSIGWHLGTSRRNGERNPLNYRSHGAIDAVQAEAVYRADKAFFENGDLVEGFDLNAKNVLKPQAGDLRDGAIDVEIITND